MSEGQAVVRHSISKKGGHPPTVSTFHFHLPIETVLSIVVTLDLHTVLHPVRATVEKAHNGYNPSNHGRSF